MPRRPDAGTFTRPASESWLVAGSTKHLLETDMSDGRPSIQIPLTAEQQALIRRLSGQQAEVLELTPESDNPASGAGEGLRFRWRLSLATGIPRQEWAGGADPKPDPGS